MCVVMCAEAAWITVRFVDGCGFKVDRWGGSLEGVLGFECVCVCICFVSISLCFYMVSSYSF